MVRGSWSEPWHLNCSPCIGLKMWDKFFCIVFLWGRLQLFQISPFSSLLLLLFAISSPHLRKLLSGPLLWVTGRVRAVSQLTLDFPSLPPLTNQRSVWVRKSLGRVWKGGSQFFTQGKWGVVPVAQPSVDEGRNMSWKGVHTSHPGKKVERPWPSYALLVLASVTLQMSVNMKSKHHVPL